MDTSTPFKWRHFQAEIILLCVRWYLRYPLSYRDLEEMMLERGLHVDHTTIYRWVQYYAPELEKRCRPHLNATNDSWRVDETYVKVKKVWMYLKRLVKLGMGFFSFETAWRTLQGYEAMNMLRKGQIHGVEKGDSMKQVTFLASLFGVAV